MAMPHVLVPRVPVRLSHRLRAAAVATAVMVAMVVPQAPPAAAIMGGASAEGDAVLVGLFTSRGSSPFCSGGLIEPRIVITAAHCIEALSDGQLLIAPPGIDTRTDPTRARALKWWIPSTYPIGSTSRNVLADDIAFVVLDRPLAARASVRLASATQVRDLQLANPSAQVSHLGYGNVNLNQSNPGLPLRLSQRLLSPTQYGNLRSGTFFATVGTSSSNICPGDSGGPVTTTIDGEIVLLGIQAGGDTACVSGYTSTDKTIGFIATSYASLLREARAFLSEDRPSAPRDVIARASGALVTLSWLAPERADGVEGYIVEASPLTTRAILGITASDDTGVRVVSVLPGSPAEASGMVANSRIEAVGSVAVTTTNDLRNELNRRRPGQEVTLSVVAPDGRQGQVRVALGEDLQEQSPGEACRTMGTEVLSCTISQGTRNVRYRVQALASEGPGEYEQIDVTVGPASAPALPRTTVSRGTVTVTWSTPTSLGTVSAADTRAVVIDRSSSREYCAVPISAQSCTFAAPLGTLSMGVFSRAIGSESAAEWLAPVTVIAAAPSQVRSPRVTKTATQWRLAWAVPADNGGRSITAYTVTNTDGKVLCRTTTRTCRIARSAAPTGSIVRISAINAVGTGRASTIRMR
jgi:hypothetical protein